MFHLGSKVAIAATAILALALYSGSQPSSAVGYYLFERGPPTVPGFTELDRHIVHRIDKASA